MELQKKRLLEKLEQLADSKFEKLFEGALNGFAYYFSKLDLEGIDSLLSDNNNYDGVSKDYYLKLIEKAFNNLKFKGIISLESIPGVCNGCIKDCNGFTFIDNKTGIYVDIIVEVNKSEITNFMECYNLKNDKQIAIKNERIVIKQFRPR